MKSTIFGEFMVEWEQPKRVPERCANSLRRDMEGQSPMCPKGTSSPNTCADCGKAISRQAVRCRSCVAPRNARLAAMKNPPMKRFWKYADTSAGPDSCWPWKGVVDTRGYGVIQINSHPVRAHRFSYKVHRGVIPDGLFVCHTCDNRACVNPAHLFVGTHQENVADMVAKGRAHPGSRHGMAKLTEADVVEIRAEYAAGGITQQALCKRYGVSQETIWAIVRRKRWTHV